MACCGICLACLFKVQNLITFFVVTGQFLASYLLGPGFLTSTFALDVCITLVGIFLVHQVVVPVINSYCHNEVMDEALVTAIEKEECSDACKDQCKKRLQKLWLRGFYCFETPSWHWWILDRKEERETCVVQFVLFYIIWAKLLLTKGAFILFLWFPLLRSLCWLDHSFLIWVVLYLTVKKPLSCEMFL